MAYTTIDKGEDHFNAVLTTGTGSSQAVTGVGFKPDWIWGKRRDSTGHHSLFDSTRGATKGLEANQTGAEFTSTDYYSSFDSDGFTIAAGAAGAGNGSGQTAVNWCWKAGGLTPSKTFKVVVVSDGGNKYRFRNSTDTATFAESATTLNLQEGGTFTFDLSDSSVDGHPLLFSTTSNGTHASGTTYETGVVYKLDGVVKTKSQYVDTTAFNAATTRQIIITIAASAPALYYYCNYHSGMGGQIFTIGQGITGNTNFDGSIKSIVTVNTTAGFSIVRWEGSGSAATIGHGLGTTPKWYFTRNRDDTEDWIVYHAGNTAAPETDYLQLNATNATGDSSGVWNDVAPTATTFSVGTANSTNGSSDEMIAYCFSEVKGFSKFGSYTGNNNSNGNFVYLGFKPAWILFKATDSGQYWHILDNKRDVSNDGDAPQLSSNTNASEATVKSDRGTASVDFLSNGFKLRSDGSSFNGTNAMVYMAFAEHPFVSSTGTPNTAR